MTTLTVSTESWPIRGSFTISRGSKTTAEVVVVTLSRSGTPGGPVGRGEAVPYARYGESMQSVLGQIESLHGPLADGLDREGLQALLPAGAARNAVDLAFWDLECKLSGKRHWELAGLPPPRPVTTAFTLSLDSVENRSEEHTSEL